ncbi:MAG: hypothetical protein ALECFALPRED_006443 [Alectoria fallacina]|uniref:Rhodopsin domain-containing protein n=1 Tax=Alectoria fallacina TaxID=1903189 RepID=A0A8H3ERV1_9LECA|nr:MAG: hypothetical protein ALECFALPRED_006443 [Alectoria fallacina]
MALSLVPLLARMGLVHLVLLWGTNNVTTEGMSARDVHYREIGSRLVLISRIMYAMFLWIAKFTISEFLKRLTSHVWKDSYEFCLQCIRWFLVVTFVAVVIATLSECQPFSHYWQVVPDPGAKCRQGNAQLITMGTSDVITDLLIVGFPIPIVLKSAMNTKRKISLVLLFALSLILVAITLYRVVSVIDRHYDQRFRSLLASLEILAAAAVSNALVLGSFVRDRGTKKQRFRFGSTGGHSSLERSTTAPRRAITARNWGSDADLVGDLGMRLDPELTEKPSSVPRPAPVAMPLHSTANVNTSDVVDESWTFPNLASVETDETDLKSPRPVREIQPSPMEIPTTPRHMSFFDVGGLLGENDAPQVRHRQSMAVYQKQPKTSSSSGLYPHAAGSRRGSHALLQDIGGLMENSSPSPRMTTFRPPPSSQNSDLIEALNSTPPNSSLRPSATPAQQRGESPGLQDIGGLLSPLPKAADPRPAPSSQRSGLIEALQFTPPNSSPRPSAPPPQKRRGPPGLQDVGGLLS